MWLEFRGYDKISPFRMQIESFMRHLEDQYKKIMAKKKKDKEKSKKAIRCDEFPTSMLNMDPECRRTMENVQEFWR